MDDCKVFVGLDYHDAGIQVCVLKKNGTILGERRLSNDAEALIRYVETFGSRVHAAVEVCTGSSALADVLVSEAGWIVDLAHPGYVHRMKRSPDKSDYSDARLLADLVRVGYLPRVWLAPPSIRELREMVRYRSQIAAELRTAKLRIGALLRAHRCGPGPAGRWTQTWMRRCTDAREHAMGRASSLPANRAADGRAPVGGAEADVHDPRGRGGSASATVLGNRSRHRLDAARRGGSVRPVRERQAVGALLRSVAAERLERRACGRRGSDSCGQREPAGGVDPGGASSDAFGPALAFVCRASSRSRQAGVCGDGGGRESMDPLVAPSDAAAAASGVGRGGRADRSGVWSRKNEIAAQRSPMTFRGSAVCRPDARW